jgi:hypothetical protein
MSLWVVNLRTFDAHASNYFQIGFIVIERDWVHRDVVWLRGTEWAPQIERRLITIAQIDDTCVMHKNTVVSESYMWPVFLAYNVRAAIRLLAVETKLPCDLALHVRSFLWW